MNQEEYLHLASEVSQLEAMLAEIPTSNVINRMGLESRLKAATAHWLAKSRCSSLKKPG